MALRTLCPFFALVVLCLTARGFSQTNERAMAIGTFDSKVSELHAEALHNRRSLACNCTIIGVEKAFAGDIGAPAMHGLAGVPEYLCEVLDDPKKAFVSHVKLSNGSFHYNYYSSNTPHNSAYSDGAHATAMLGTALRQEFAQCGATHVFVVATGWLNNQRSSLAKLEAWDTALRQSVPQNVPFNPYYVLITWPSKWLEGAPDENPLKNLVSYPIKADDSDEVGCVWGVKVLRAVSEAAGNGVRIAVVGHSMGARLVAQAVSSQRLDGLPRARADLLLCLQGAFSINRFIVGEGVEGSPFADFRDWGSPVVLTSSKSDRTLARAFLLYHSAGAYKAFIQAKEHPQLFSRLSEVNVAPGALSRNLVNYVDCSAAITSHGDVFNTDVAALVHEMLR